MNLTFEIESKCFVDARDRSPFRGAHRIVVTQKQTFTKSLKIRPCDSQLSK